MDHRWACLTLFLVLLADTARGQGCGLSAFRHVPQTHCRGDELVVDEPQVGSVEACAQACCDNPACKSFQYSTYGDCYLISKICTDEEKETVPIGNMYDRIQGEARPQASAGCGLSAFRHVPQTHCEGYENLVDQPQVGSADACAKACCDNPACKSFQFSIHKICLLINKICTDEEKMSTPIGNMYDRIQAGPSGPRRVCENQRLSISCPAGQQINIVSALYGRTTGEFCPSGPIRTTNCRSSTSLTRVRTSCQGKSTCSVAASNSVFGDPCVGTYKYLEVSSTCIQPWRDDLRCGARYPAPNGQPAGCNPDGKYPCCAPSGWCGKTTAHCACSRCVDYRKASKRMVEARETLQDLRDVLLDLEEAVEIEQETRELEDMGEDVDMAEDAEKEVRELEEIEENAGMAEDDE